MDMESNSGVKFLIAGCTENEIYFWNDSAEPLFILQATNKMTYMYLDSFKILTCHVDGTIKLWHSPSESNHREEETKQNGFQIINENFVRSFTATSNNSFVFADNVKMVTTSGTDILIWDMNAKPLSKRNLNKLIEQNESTPLIKKKRQEEKQSCCSII